MTFTEQIITIAAVVAGTMLTRFLPFILFPANKKTPPLVAFLGKMLPAAVMGMLVGLLPQGYTNYDRQSWYSRSHSRSADSYPAGNPAQSAADDSNRHYRLYAAGAICIYVKNVRKQAQRYQQSCNTKDNIPHI